MTFWNVNETYQPWKDIWNAVKDEKDTGWYKRNASQKKVLEVFRVLVPVIGHHYIDGHPERERPTDYVEEVEEELRPRCVDATSGNAMR